jgi:hypothetical protein
MAIEAKRGCGYRKVGGLYMMGGKLAAPCCKLPLLLHTRPAGAVLTMVPLHRSRIATTQAGFKQVRGYVWVDPRPMLEAVSCNVEGGFLCSLALPESLADRTVLMWIGTAFYPTPADFTREAASLGVSRRIQAVPKGFVLGEHSVFLAHPKVRQGVDPDNAEAWTAGIFAFFKPTSIDKIVTETQSRDTEEMERLTKAGITAVVVPDDDKDHQGSVYDAEDEEPGLELNGGAGAAQSLGG